MWDITTVTLFIFLCVAYLWEAYKDRKAWREFMKGMEPEKDKGGQNDGKG